MSVSNYHLNKEKIFYKNNLDKEIRSLFVLEDAFEKTKFTKKYLNLGKHNFYVQKINFDNKPNLSEQKK